MPQVAGAKALHHPPRAMSARMVAGLLALLMGIQPITTDLYLPALPTVVEVFGASLAQGQLTLTVLLLCFGVAQLVFGPLSDRYGRRPVLLWGLGLYTAAGVANTLAPSMGFLVASRAVQGAAMGSAVMCARAIVRDLYGPVDGARVMAKALTGLGVIACASPLLGGLLAQWAGWRWALAMLAAFGAVTWGLIALRFEETLAQRNLAALQWRVLARNWLAIARNPVFLVWTGLLVASYAALFTYLAASAFVFIKVYGFSRPLYGLAMAGISLSFIAGTVVCRRWVPRWGLQGAVQRAAGLSLAAGTVMGCLGLLGVHTWWAFWAPMAVFLFAHGIHQPCSQTGAVSPFAQTAGTASALSGFLLTVVAFGVGAWLGWRLEAGTAAPLVNSVWMWSVVIALVTWAGVRRFAAVPAQV